MFFLFYSSLFIFLSCIFAWLFIDPFELLFQKIFVVRVFDIYYNFGLDGISLFFIYLTSFLLPLCILFSWNSRSPNKVHFIYCLFSIELLLLIVFSVMDVLLFYIFFEIILIPFFIYIGICGYRARRIHAAYLFFFYTLFGSLLMLVAILSIYLHSGTTDINLLHNTVFSTSREYLLWICFFMSFGVKVPIFPFHVWLPEAHVEAPTEGSVLLAGILLKLGTYGFLRFVFILFPHATLYFAPFVLMLSSLAVFYTSLTTLRQIDIKKIIAYSSVAHMNMGMIGLFLFDPVAVTGCFLMMIGHGIISGGLFFMVGVLYDRYKTKLIQYYSGIVQLMPLFSVFLFLFILGNISMPGTANFISEFLVICGVTSKFNVFLMFIVSSGIFLGTLYSMWLYNKISFGMPYYGLYEKIKDLSLNEFLILFSLAIHMFWLGIYPNSFLDLFNYSIYSILLEVL